MLAREDTPVSAAQHGTRVDLVVIARPGADALKLAEVRAEWMAVERLVRKRATEALAQRGVAVAQPLDGFTGKRSSKRSSRPETLSMSSSSS